MWSNEKTPEQKAAFNRFLKRLDSRYFLIQPVGVEFRGSALGAKHKATKLLDTLPIGESIYVIEGYDTVVWCQQRRELRAV